MVEIPPPADGVSKGVAAVRSYRVERAAMRVALRDELRAARADLRARRMAAQSPAIPTVPDPTMRDGAPAAFQADLSAPQDTPAVTAPSVASATISPPVAPVALPPRVAPTPVSSRADATTRLPADTAISPTPVAPATMPAAERAASADSPEPSVLGRLLQTVAAASPAPVVPPVVPPPQAAPAPPQPTCESPTLARLGFGVGMSARLNQLGIHDAGDLAVVEPDRLRAALGEISRLVDIDAWVAHARALTAPE